MVIIGQDPYPSPNEAMGLSFSVPKGIKVPASLKRIYKCLENDKEQNFKSPTHGDLTKWAEQGVLLLNATFTVEHKSPNSHKKCGWLNFTDEVIKKISAETKGVVFLLWGNFAIEKGKLVDSDKHAIITNIHPSPLAASSGDFLNSKQFSEVNEALKKFGKSEISWNAIC